MPETMQGSPHKLKDDRSGVGRCPRWKRQAGARAAFLFNFSVP